MSAARRAISSSDSQPFSKPDLLGTGDLDAGAMFERAHEGRSVVQAVVRAGVEPRIAASETRDLEIAAFEIGAVHVGYLELAPGGRRDRLGDFDHVRIVEVETGDRPVGLRIFGLFLDRSGRPGCGIERRDAVALGIVDVVGEHVCPALCRPTLPPRGIFRRACRHSRCCRRGRDSRDASPMKSSPMRKASASPLGFACSANSKRTPNAEPSPRSSRNSGQVSRRGNDEDIANARKHEDRQRIEDHRLVVDG